MKCRNVQKRLALILGGDAPERMRDAVLSHIGECRDCAQEWEFWKSSREYALRLAKSDRPDPLPAEFPHKVLRIIEKERTPSSRQRLLPLRVRPALGITGVVLAVLAVIFISFELFPPEAMTPEKLLRELERISRTQEGDLSWDVHRKALKAFADPVRVDRWDSPAAPGIYAILHKTEAGEKPVSYTVAYCGQSRDLSGYRTYPWIEQRMRRLIARTGSLENVYIATLLLPESSQSERSRLARALIEAFHPYFNDGV